MTLRVPEFLPTNAYTFQQLRYLMGSLGVQPGVMAGGDLKVSEHAGGANMSVDVAAGNAWIDGTSIALQGMYHEFNDAVLNVASFTAADPSLPRIDQIILAVQDSSISGLSDTPSLQIITGTATAGAQCLYPQVANYRSGAVSDSTIRATYPNFIRLADVGVPASVGSIVNSYIVDRRPWALGAYFQGNGSVSGDYSTGSGSYSVIDGVNLIARLECSGLPIELAFSFNYSNNSTPVDAEIGEVIFAMDGARVGPITFLQVVPVPNLWVGGLVRAYYQFTPTAGTHIFSPDYKLTGGGGALFIGGTTVDGPASFTIREIMRGSANNGNG